MRLTSSHEISAKIVCHDQIMRVERSDFVSDKVATIC